MDRWAGALEAALGLSRFVLDEVAAQIAEQLVEVPPAVRSDAQKALLTWWAEHDAGREVALRARDAPPEDPVAPTVVERIANPAEGRLHVAVAPRW
jgi:hypothetical protein